MVLGQSASKSRSTRRLHTRIAMGSLRRNLRRNALYASSLRSTLRSVGLHVTIRRFNFIDILNLQMASLQLQGWHGATATRRSASLSVPFGRMPPSISNPVCVAVCVVVHRHTGLHCGPSKSTNSVVIFGVYHNSWTRSQFDNSWARPTSQFVGQVAMYGLRCNSWSSSRLMVCVLIRGPIRN
jgi:hypothetical protein